MPTPTYDLIASNVLTSSASSVTFSSIPATYRDLVLVIDGRSDTSSDYITFRVNGDTGNNYPFVVAFGDGTTTTSQTNTQSRFFLNPTGGAATGARIQGIAHILDYSTTDKHKTALIRGNVPTVELAMWAARWANTSAINSIVISALLGNLNSGSTFYLYGIVS